MLITRREQIKDGKEYVAWRLEWREGGKRKNTSRSNREEAHTLADEIATRMAKGEVRHRILTGLALQEYEEAVEICSQAECSILDAARLIKANKRPLQRRTLEEVRAEFLESKSRRSKRHFQSLTNDTKLLTDRFGSRFILDLHVSELTEWINSMPVEVRTKQNRWSNNRTMFRWARRIGYLPDMQTEIDRVDSALWAQESREDWEDDEGIDDVCLLTPDQLRALFDVLPRRLIPVLALGAFAGVRRSETSRLHWRMVKEDHIELPRIIARKKKRRRRAPYLPACSAWLESCREEEGLIIPHGDRFNQVTAIAKKLGINPWPQNVLRHSFISYRLALVRNAPQVAEEAGTSVEKIRSNYDEKATRKDAENWFEIFPPTLRPLIESHPGDPTRSEISPSSSPSSDVQEIWNDGMTNQPNQ